MSDLGQLAGLRADKLTLNRLRTYRHGNILENGHVVIIRRQWVGILCDNGVFSSTE